MVVLVKPLNAGIQNEWQDFMRRKFPRSAAILDLDAYGIGEALHTPDDDTWPMLYASDSRPTALVEVKRGRAVSVDKWRPFAADAPNYEALLQLADASDIPLFVVYYERVDRIEDSTRFHVFLLREVVRTSRPPEYHGRRELMTAGEFLRRFPLVFPTEQGAT